MDRDAGGARRSSGRVTIQDIAQKAGVSRSTTSRALNGTGYVAADVRDRVRAAARELRYVPDIAARNFKRGRGTSVGLLVADLRDALHSDLAAGVSERLASGTLTLMASHTTFDEGRQLAAAEAFASRRVEGMIITPLGDRTTRYLQNLDIPVVEVDGMPSTSDCDRVMPDARAAGATLARHVQDLGHRRVVTVLSAAPTASHLQFAAGCADVLGPPENDPAASYREVHEREIEAIDLDEEGGRGPTAVLAASTAIAEQLWSGPFRRGARSPEQVSLAVFGEAPWMRLVEPPVTTVCYDVAELGVRAAERLLRRLAHPEEETTVELVPIELVVRGSTARRAPAAAPPAVGTREAEPHR